MRRLICYLVGHRIKPYKWRDITRAETHDAFYCDRCGTDIDPLLYRKNWNWLTKRIA